MRKLSLQEVLFSFSGRIGRAQFWLGQLLILATIVIIGLVAGRTMESPVNALTGIALLLLAWPSLAVAVKRWHDRGKSGWWVLVALVPIIGHLWALIETGFLPGVGEGSDPTDSNQQPSAKWWGPAAVVAYVVGMATIVVNYQGLLPGGVSGGYVLVGLAFLALGVILTVVVVTNSAE